MSIHDISSQYYVNNSIFYSLRAYNKHRTEITKAVTRSALFKDYLNFVKEQGMDRSATLGKIQVKNHKDDDGIRIYPFIGPYISDKDMILVLTRYAIGEDLRLSSLEIGDIFRNEFIKYNNAPIMFLDKTSLEMTINESILPPSCSVFGRPDRFIEKYRKYVDKDMIRKFELIQNLGDTFKMGKYGNKFAAPDWVDFSTIL